MFRCDRARHSESGRGKPGRIIVALLPLSIAAVIVWPLFVYPLVQWAGSAWFANHLTVGMTRAKVDALRTLTFGYRQRESTDAQTAHRGITTIQFATIVAVCNVSGTVYQLSFDQRDHLSSWKSGGWADGC